MMGSDAAFFAEAITWLVVFRCLRMLQQFLLVLGRRQPWSGGVFPSLVLLP